MDYPRERMSPALEERFGERIDRAVWKVSGLLPVEWSVELGNVIRALVAEAADAGLGGAPDVSGASGISGAPEHPVP